MILEEAKQLETERSSEYERKTTTKNNKSGKSLYTPGVSGIPKENTSDLDGIRKNENVVSMDSGADISNSSGPREEKTRKRVLSDSDAEKKRSKTAEEEVDNAIGSESDVHSNKRRKSMRVVMNKRDLLKETRLPYQREERRRKRNAVIQAPKQRRKNTRKVINKKDLLKETRNAEQNEERRKQRTAERHEKFKEILEASGTAVKNSFVLDFDRTTKIALVTVDPNIVKKLKPHQVEGVRFMWDSCFETVKNFKNPNYKGSGCILAHYMGLGKTLQMGTLLYTVMTSLRMGLKTALVICPFNTVENWCSELNKWFKDVDKNLPIHKLYTYERDDDIRAQAYDAWHQTGGVGIINYEIFRSLVQKGNCRFTAALLDPGPEIVVCDEGHVFKNNRCKMAVAINRIKTKRRIILSGTPLQNNLSEYHCMMEFVKPHLLGTKTEFSNRFVNPITNGQHKDSTPLDVSIMKKRTHVLHKLLNGCVQRLDSTVLLKDLPPKYEYVVLINMTEIQKKMYTFYLENIKEGKTVRKSVHSRKDGKLWEHAAQLAKVWCHPNTLKKKSANYNAKSADCESEGSLKDDTDECSDAVDSGSNSDTEFEESELESDSEIEINATPGPMETGSWKKNSQGIKNGRDWWSQFFSSDTEMLRMEHSSKLVVLFEILKACVKIGDKVLVFSQYLYSLDIIESHLKKLDELEDTQDTFPSEVSRSRWRKDIEYFRIDGSTKFEVRQKAYDSFNNASSSKLFLLSTRAGGVGINLVGANRVVIFDVSWNPSHDMQSISRAFRYGQKKTCYVYRLIATGTMEEKIYNRQVLKLSLSRRVVDDHQIERNFKYKDIDGMYTFEPDKKSNRPMPPVPENDKLLTDLLISHKDTIETYWEHDSLLQNLAGEELTDEEQQTAWDEYQKEKESERSQQSSDDTDADTEVT